MQQFDGLFLRREGLQAPSKEALRDPGINNNRVYRKEDQVLYNSILSFLKLLSDDFPMRPDSKLHLDVLCVAFV